MQTTVTPQQWDSFVRAQPRAHALQLYAWGQLKAAFSWEVVRVSIQDEGQNIIAAAQILLRALPLRLGKMAYLPMGVYAPPQHTADLWQAIHKAARAHGARFLKWEPGIYGTDEPVPDFEQLGFRLSPQTIQPPNTLLIDLDADDDTLLARMNQGTRRKIRTGDKKGVRFYQGTAADVGAFTAMMQTTGSRNEFGVHTASYYQMAFDLFAADDTAALFMAEHEGDTLAGIMVFAVGTGAWYLYGASSDVKRNLMGTYGVQWQAIQWAREKGYAYYDLWGIPDADEAMLEAQFESRADGLWGVYGFKRGFGGRVARSVGAWDYVYNPVIYAAYKAALRLRG
ncbi:MAG: Lipid II:glycine glycyltransferase (Peptidoglycan interpeptide bridge formation enzyme) [Chloroflexi bacterium AL-W]|nr:Lipid II:glycine glycyltransferase (Peptidoglycan interpeptide bridge formation enzyme) [Chloroflexi bacterium AL-W]